MLDLASDEQQDRYLAGLAKGSVLTAALNEPGAALPDRPATTFVHSRLSGTKVGVVYAENAEWMLVTADSAVVVVSPKADGVQICENPDVQRVRRVRGHVLRCRGRPTTMCWPERRRSG